MPVLTAAVLAAFLGYAAAWYVGMVEGNFALLLFLATAVTGVYWVAERLWFLPRRREAAARMEAEAASRRASLAAQGITQTEWDAAHKREVDRIRAEMDAIRREVGFARSLADFLTAWRRAPASPCWVPAPPTCGFARRPACTPGGTLTWARCIRSLVGTGASRGSSGTS